MLNDLLALKRKIKYQHLSLVSLEANVDTLIYNYKKNSEIPLATVIGVDGSKLMELVKLKLFVDPKDLKGPKRHRELVEIRFIMYKILKRQGYTLKKIGSFFNRDHATILHGLKKFDELSIYDGFKTKYETINQLFNN